jgi:hypothetical protein
MVTNENPKPIRTVEPLNDFKLKISFYDGDRIVDLKTFNLLGVFKNLIKDKRLFDTVHLDEGIITWEGGLMLENNDLYYHGYPAERKETAKLKKVLQKIIEN